MIFPVCGLSADQRKRLLAYWKMLLVSWRNGLGEEKKGEEGREGDDIWRKKCHKVAALPGGPILPSPFPQGVSFMDAIVR